MTDMLPGLDLITDTDVLASLAHDEAEWAPVGRPIAAVRPQTTEEVQRIVAACAEKDIAVVTRGAGTGLSGGANAVDGCVVVDLSKMNKILEIDADNMIAVVQPGVINDDLKAAVAAHGLWYPPDPASSPWSTIGGNVATNAGGLCCLKYGVTGDYVLGLQAVVGGPAGAYGTAVRLGRRTTKGVTGYDLVGLFVGSEGTLGVVTEVTLRLRPARKEPPRTVVGAFASVVAAGDGGRREHPPRTAAERARTAGPALPAGRRGLEAPGPDHRRGGVAAGPDRHAGRGRRDESAAMAEAFTAAGASGPSGPPTSSRRRRCSRRGGWPTRRWNGSARYSPRTSACPDRRCRRCWPRSRRSPPGHGATIATIAHAGDGNLHPLILSPPGDDAARTAAQAAFEEMLAAAIGWAAR